MKEYVCKTTEKIPMMSKLSRWTDSNKFVTSLEKKYNLPRSDIHIMQYFFVERGNRELNIGLHTTIIQYLLSC
jgi:hypothetical protein